MREDGAVVRGSPSQGAPSQWGFHLGGQIPRRRPGACDPLLPFLFSPLCVCSVAQSCPTLCDPMAYSPPGISQARILEWVATSYSRGSSRLRDQTQVACVSCTVRGVLCCCTVWGAKRNSRERGCVPSFLWPSEKSWEDQCLAFCFSESWMSPCVFLLCPWTCFKHFLGLADRGGDLGETKPARCSGLGRESERTRPSGKWPRALQVLHAALCHRGLLTFPRHSREHRISRHKLSKTFDYLVWAPLPVFRRHCY